MTNYFDRLNLRPQERRLVVGVGTILFVVVNLWLVRPHLDDWKRVQTELEGTRQTLASYQAEAARIPEYRATLKRLEDQGSAVLPEEQAQALRLQRTVNEQAMRSGVIVPTITPTSRAQSSTNAYFEERSLSIDIPRVGDKELVDFLYNLGAGSSMIRVRDLTLQRVADPTQVRLNCRATLIASYQKVKTEPKTSGTATNQSVAIHKP